MPRPVSDSIAGGLPLWDTYEASFFLVTGVFLGVVLGFLFPSLWRSFRRRFRKMDRFKPDRMNQARLPEQGAVFPEQLQSLNEDDDASVDQDVGTLFVAARYAVQEMAYREAVSLYLRILGSELVSKVQTNRAMFELSQVYALSGLPMKAFETGVELLHRKPTHTDVFRFLLRTLADEFDEEKLDRVVKVYAGPTSAELSREVSHILATASQRELSRGSDSARQAAVRLAKLAVRWSPSALEPKIALVQATSVLWTDKKDRPIDQMLVGFCVDLTELALMRRNQPKLSPSSVESFIAAWVNELNASGGMLSETIVKMRSEILSIFKVDPRVGSVSPVFDLSFVWTVVSNLRKKTMPVVATSAESGEDPSWDGTLRELLGLPEPTQDQEQIHVCSSCLEVRRTFSWQCSSCKSWETLGIWSGA